MNVYWLVGLALSAVVGLWVLHFVSYSVLKNRILHRRRWDLNICCGETDGGGINADIVQHAQVPQLVLVDVYHLPFPDGAFDKVLSSHTVEHVTDPEGFFRELARVGDEVTLVIPPLWDLSAVVNVFEHRWIFLSLRKVHTALPEYVRLPLARIVQQWLGQRVRA